MKNITLQLPQHIWQLLCPTKQAYVFIAWKTPIFGVVEIKTKQDLLRQESLYLVHPWLDALLGREEMQCNVSVQDDVTGLTDNEDNEDAEEIEMMPCHPEPKAVSHPATMNVAPVDKETALKLIAHLTQPFGGLLLILASMC